MKNLLVTPRSQQIADTSTAAQDIHTTKAIVFVCANRFRSRLALLPEIANPFTTARNVPYYSSKFTYIRSASSNTYTGAKHLIFQWHTMAVTMETPLIVSLPWGLPWAAMASRGLPWQAPRVATDHGAITVRAMVVLTALAVAVYGCALARGMANCTACHESSPAACHGKPHGMPCQPMATHASDHTRV